MKRTLIFLSLPLIALAPALSFGNGPRLPAPLWYLRQPDKAGNDKLPARGKVVGIAENAPVSMLFRSDITRPQIIIPQQFVVADRKFAPKAEADAPGGRTLFAGISLSAAFVTGGFWLLRRSSKAGKVMLILFLLSGTMFVSPFVSDSVGDIAVPEKRPKELDPLKIDGTTAKLGMDIVVVAEGDRVQVLLPKRLLPTVMIPTEQFEKWPAFPGFTPVPDLPPKKAEKANPE